MSDATEDPPDDTGTRKWPVVGGVLAVLWVFVRGVPADPAALVGELLIGAAVGLPVAALFRPLYTERVRLGRSLRAAPYATLYVGTFLRELLTANVDVAYRVLSPGMPISPEVVVIPLRVERDAAVTTIANSITLTPGTLTMDHDPEANALYVHTIDGRDPASVVAPIRQWEDYALVIFGERLQPGDPAPEPARTADGRSAEPDRWGGGGG
ncbi:MAG: Na+/H+ antiporter subunit E [Halobacteriaceae archaeon]